MQETEFISRNKDKWKEFEEVLASKNKDPERLTELFIETTDDLSYSRTYYRNRSVRVYLNGIAQQVYQSIYKNKKKEKNAFSKFWKEELPDAMWHSRKYLLYAFLLFAAGIGIGIFSSMYYPEFARIILGDGYIEMTKANIEKGDPMAVYKESEPISMFLTIALNNIMIAFGTFVLGISFGIGTVYIILYNAIMVGTFIYFFIERGLFRESFLAIMLHGTLELSMIVVAGCAGFVLAAGLIFPGTYTRGQALMNSARHGIKILLGVAVLLLYAAFIESFATRHTDMPDVLRAGIILLSASLVIGYFVWYPRARFKRGLTKPIEHAEKPKPKEKNFNLLQIKTSGKIFTETFELFSANIRSIAILSLIFASVVTLSFGLFTKGKFHQLFQQYSDNAFFDWLWPWSSFDGHLNFDKFPWLFPLLAILSSIYVFQLFKAANKQFNLTQRNKTITTVANGMIILSLSLSPLGLPHLATVVLLPVTISIGLIWYYTSMIENALFYQSLGRTFRLIAGNFWRILGVFMGCLIIQWIALFIVSSDLSLIIARFVSMNIPRNAYLAEEATYIFDTFLLFFIFAIICSLTVYGSALLYHCIKEINEASSLRSSIGKIGFKKRVYGLEHEL